MTQQSQVTPVVECTLPTCLGESGVFIGKQQEHNLPNHFG